MYELHDSPRLRKKPILYSSSGGSSAAVGSCSSSDCRRCGKERVKTTRQRPEHAGRHREHLLAGVVVRHLSNRLAKYWGTPVHAAIHFDGERQRPALAHVVDAFGQVDLPDKAGEHGPVEEGLREGLWRVPLRVARVRVRGHRHGEVHGKEEADGIDGAKERRDKARTKGSQSTRRAPPRKSSRRIKFGRRATRQPWRGPWAMSIFSREVLGMRPRQGLLALRPAATSPRELGGRR